jgi:hypothetical protein
MTISLALTPANYDKENSNNTNQKQLKTIMNKVNKSKKLYESGNNIDLNSELNNDDCASDSDDDNNFNPPPKPVSIGVNKTNRNNNDNNEDTKKQKQNKNIETFTNIPDLSQEHYDDTVKYYDRASGVNTANHTLLKKLNYMILLLEEQKDIKQNSVTEELILYLFLGIFIIFILDSFARASKYVR